MRTLLDPYIKHLEDGRVEGYQWLTRAGGHTICGLFRPGDTPEYNGNWIGHAVGDTPAAAREDVVVLPSPYDAEDQDLWLFTKAFEAAAPGVRYQLIYPADKPSASIPRC